MEEIDYMDHCNLGLGLVWQRISLGVTWTNDNLQRRDRHSATILLLLDLSATFSIIDHGILLKSFCELVVRIIVPRSSIPSCIASLR